MPLLPAGAGTYVFATSDMSSRPPATENFGTEVVEPVRNAQRATAAALMRSQIAIAAAAAGAPDAAATRY
jgi:hypothetical protein